MIPSSAGTQNVDPALLQSLIDNIPGFVSCVDAETLRYQAVNASFEKGFNLSRDRIVGAPVREILGESNFQFALKYIEEVRRGKPVSYENDFNLGPSKRRLLVNYMPIRNPAGKVVSFSVLGTDITERKEIEERLELMARSIEVSSDAVYWLDSDGRFTYSNAKGCEALGYSLPELLALNVADVNRKVTPELWAETRRILRSSGSFTAVSSHRRKDGSEFPVEILSTLITINGREYINGFARDITSRKRIEEELLRSQRLESLGVFAGGIAHDFNNLLSIIFGNLQLIRGTPEDAESLAACLKTMGRAKSITAQLLTFAKGGLPVKKIATLDGFLRETVNFALSGTNCAAVFRLGEGLWPLEYDQGQIGQVFDNIVINAVQAMPRGGKLDVSAENVPARSGRGPGSRAGDYVKISFRDHGIGMSGDVMPHVFDPYYTTKETGRGLGLASVYSIVKNHAGFIEVESEMGTGSTFSVFLPASRTAVAEPGEAPAPVLKCRGKILVLDDEPDVRDMVVRMLNAIGCEAVGVGSGEETLAALNNPAHGGDPFTAAILDLTIPGGMGGREIAEKIRESAPGLPLFVASGYSDDPVMADPGRYGFAGSLAKPFVSKDLIDMLNQGLKKI